MVFIVYHLSEPKFFCDWQFICFLGKWVLTKDYIIHSAKSGKWLDETTYEWGYKIEKDSHYSPQMQSAPKRWREELKRTGAPGAFHRWKVVLLVRADKRSDSLVRWDFIEAKAVNVKTILGCLNTFLYFFAIIHLFQMSLDDLLFDLLVKPFCTFKRMCLMEQNLFYKYCIILRVSVSLSMLFLCKLK